jgi:MFS family permease
VNEVFPMEIRTLAIAIFYAIGTGIGGVLAPAIFGVLIEGGNRADLFLAYLLGASVMIIAAIVEIFLDVKAEGQSLESVARPLTAREEATGPSAASATS